MKKLTISLIFGLILLTSFVNADNGHAEHDVEEQAEAIINAQIPCSLLTNSELEYVGEYFMEKMHSGEAHNKMDERMGGHGSESLERAHIQMANLHYCSQFDEYEQYDQLSILQDGKIKYAILFLYLSIILFCIGMIVLSIKMLNRGRKTKK